MTQFNRLIDVTNGVGLSRWRRRSSEYGRLYENTSQKRKERLRFGLPMTVTAVVPVAVPTSFSAVATYDPLSESCIPWIVSRVPLDETLTLSDDSPADKVVPSGNVHVIVGVGKPEMTWASIVS